MFIIQISYEHCTFNLAMAIKNVVFYLSCNYLWYNALYYLELYKYIEFSREYNITLLQLYVKSPQLQNQPEQFCQLTQYLLIHQKHNIKIYDNLYKYIYYNFKNQNNYNIFIKYLNNFINDKRIYNVYILNIYAKIIQIIDYKLAKLYLQEALNIGYRDIQCNFDMSELLRNFNYDRNNNNLILSYYKKALKYNGEIRIHLDYQVSLSELWYKLGTFYEFNLNNDNKAKLCYFKSIQRCDNNQHKLLLINFLQKLINKMNGKYCIICKQYRCKIYVCFGCKKTRYCSKKHQKLHWNQQHRQICCK